MNTSTATAPATLTLPTSHHYHHPPIPNAHHNGVRVGAGEIEIETMVLPLNNINGHLYAAAASLHPGPMMVDVVVDAPPPLYPPQVSDSIQAALQRSARLNSTGVSHLFAGHVGSALVSFRSALEQLERASPLLIRTQAQNRAATRATDANIVNRNDVLQQQQETMPHRNEALGHENLPVSSIPGPALESVEIPNFQDDYIYIYNRALDFSQDLIQQSRRHGHLVSSQEEEFTFQVAFYSAIIMFNIGLCMHKRGLASTSHQDLCLLNAIHFYDMCIQTISSIPIAEYSDKLMLVMLAVWNNQSQIYYQLGSYPSAFEIMEGVRLLSARLLFEQRSSSLDNNDQGHIFEFVLNVAVLRVPTTAACA